MYFYIQIFAKRALVFNRLLRQSFSCYTNLKDSYNEDEMLFEVQWNALNYLKVIGLELCHCCFLCLLTGV